MAGFSRSCLHAAQMYFKEHVDEEELSETESRCPEEGERLPMLRLFKDDVCR